MSSSENDDRQPPDGADVPLGDATGSASGNSPGEPKAKKQRVQKKVVVRGKRMTPAKRMVQHPGEFMVVGDEMWCIACQTSVCYRQATTAKNHVASAKHLENKKKRARLVSTPGPAAALQTPVASSQSQDESVTSMHTPFYNPC